ncbi:MAG: outer membrane protein assembly factor BamD [Acidobacteria bacterium]|nr:outer membrane protein assembly factor BamD [Acidobacteriota bacterium]
MRYRVLALAMVGTVVFTSGCFRKKKYENPITKDTLQPDKVLYDKAIKDIERSRFEVARITLNTLMNTYDTSEFLAKAKLAIADSWFREGGTHGLAQAEAEYKDFILFYPTMEEAAEAQEKVCNIHYKQMEKADRDPKHALRAEDECRLVLTQFPNSKFAPQAQQLLRNIQEALASAEFKVGSFYHTKGSFPAAANRLQVMSDQYPLYSQNDQALWKLGDAYGRMGDRFKDKTAAAYTRIVKDYPLSSLVDDAKKKLEQMERPIPEADPVALARMKYEQENSTPPGRMKRALGIFSKSPDLSLAAKSGTPAMETMRPSIPASVPASATGGTGVSADVSGAVVTDPTALDTKPDARQNPPSPDAAAKPAEETKPAEPLPTNRQLKERKKSDKKKTAAPK